MTPDPANFPAPAFVRPGEKMCAACREAKPLDAFHRDPRRLDGRKGRCADCCNAWKRAKYARNPEPIKAQNRASYAKHAEARREYARDYLAERRAEINARTRLVYATDPEYRERRLEAKRRWAEANPEKKAAIDRAYRQRRAS